MENPETPVPVSTSVLMAALQVSTNTILVGQVELGKVKLAEENNWTLVRPDSSIKQNELNYVIG